MVEQSLGGKAGLNRNANLLRGALLTDAIGSGASAVLVLAAAEWLGPYLGLPVSFVRGTGLVLIPFVALLAVAAGRLRPSWLIWLVIAFNLVWAVASVVLIISGAVSPTTLGATVIVGQAVAVLALGVLQDVGLQQIEDGQGSA